MRWLFQLLLLFTTFHAAAQVNRNDVVIDEIMADPSPAKGLPEAEFIELANTSGKSINLFGWNIVYATGTATISTAFVLQPDSFVIVCSASTKARWAQFGTTLAASSFPSLSNTSELLSLRSADGKLIHAVQYNKAWYRNDLKSEGGWTLEMIDLHNACSGASNWKACTDDKGGTPGKRNAASGVNPDRLSPTLVHAYAPDSASVVMVFDEPLDSAGAADIQKYMISDGIGIPARVIVLSPLFNRVVIYMGKALQKTKAYMVTVKSISDCSGNTLPGTSSVKTGVAALPDSSDLVINEVLFNPKPGGTDYVEIYNRSKNIFDIKNLYLANRSGSNQLGSLSPLSVESRLLFPTDYLVVTEDAAMIQQQYAVKNRAAFAQVSTMPSYPNDKGTVVLLNAAGKILDELSYDERWQFPLISNPQGVALERIDYNKPTQDAANWHSAASTAGYGTPTYQNSQLSTGSQVAGSIVTEPAIISPDNDGFNDFTTFTYRFPEPGYVCNITLYNAAGIPVLALAHNAACGTSGYFRWNGLDQRNARLPMGVYIALIEVFNLKGKTGIFKKAVTVAGSFR